MADNAIESVHGVVVLREALDTAAQCALLEAVRACAEVAPPFHPVTPWGKPMSAQITAAGRFCWHSDCKGYRYVEAHPGTGAPFPPIPEAALAVWRLFESRADPDCCLINYYKEGARMGLHQDRDEADYSFPVVSISLGDPGLFRIGGVERKAPTRSFWLHSGDAMALAGDMRLAHHGVDRIKFGESPLLPKGGRLNLTLRRVAAFEAE